MGQLETATERAHRERMQAVGMPEIAIRAFLRMLGVVHDGHAATLSEDSIEPVRDLPRAAALRGFEAVGQDALSQAVVIKLNGGLGTSMGLSDAKSLLPVRPGMTFLDLIARQVLFLRESAGIDLPLILMNSFRTRDSSLKALATYGALQGSLPLDFLQHQVPRVDPATLLPIDWPADRDLEWCPPGHGDLYAALDSSGLLDRLLESGRRYAFVSNADNLGGTLDARILGWFVKREIPFAMEVAERTSADRKGGHLALRGGRLVLRESAQCAPEDEAAFQDTARYRYFNTNNLWLDLAALRAKLDVSPDGLPLPVIRNEKRVSSHDPESPRCLQLETAMGSAIECFEGSEVICVSRERFAPVKTTNDLLGTWSDAYEITEDSRLVAVDPDADRRRVIDLDPRFYGTVEDLVKRFPKGVPSLRACRGFTVRGDHRFGAGVRIEGDVTLVNEAAEPIQIAAGAVLGGAA